MKDHPLENLPALFAQFLEQLRAELATSNQGIRDHGAIPRTLDRSDPTKGTAVSGAPGSFVGFSLEETTGASSALVRLRNGRTADGGVLMSVRLGPGETTRDWFGPAGISYGDGLYLDVVTGSVTGCVFLAGVEA